MAVSEQELAAIYQAYLGRAPKPEEYKIHLEGGFSNNPEGLEASIANSPEAIAFTQRGPLSPEGEEGGFEFPSFEMSEVESNYFNLLSGQIEEQLRVSKEENARVAARRAALDKQIRAQYGIGLEEFEAQEAFRSAQISRKQSKRLQKALEGKLPVDPALERQIVEDEKTVRSKLLAQLGTGYEVSSPGIESLADFRQRAEELRSAARRDEIAAGISPSAATAQFGLSLIGAENPPDSTSIAQGLQAAIGSRSAGIQAAQVRSQSLIAMQELAQRDRLAKLEFELNRMRLQGANEPQPRQTGSGYGSALGTAIGASAPYVVSSFRQNRSHDPFYT